MAITTLLNQVTGTGAGSASGGPAGCNSYQATVTGTGALTATVVVEVSNNGANVASDGIAPSNSARWEFSRGNVTAISGTGAAVTLLMSH